MWLLPLESRVRENRLYNNTEIISGIRLVRVPEILVYPPRAQTDFHFEGDALSFENKVILYRKFSELPMHEFIVLQSSEYRYSRCLGASVFICFVATIIVTP